MSAESKEVTAAVNEQLMARVEALNIADVDQANVVENILIATTKAGASEGVKAVIELDEVKPLINTPDQNGLTPIIWAVLLGHGEIVEILQKAGATTDLTTHQFSVPNAVDLKDDILMLAIRNNFENGVRYIVSNAAFNALINKLNAQGVAPIVLAMLLGLGKIVEILTPVSTVNLETHTFANGDNAVMFATRNKAVAGVQYLVSIPKFQAQVKKSNSQGLTPLILAGLLGEGQMVDALAPYSDIQLETYRFPPDSESILISAIRNNLIDGVKYLADKYKALVNTPDQKGIMPIMWAALLGRGEMVDVLKAAGATTNLVTHRFPNKDTLLIVASASNLKEGVQYLLQGETKALLNECNTAGQSAVYIAFMKGHIDIANMLKTAGADLAILRGTTVQADPRGPQPAVVPPKLH